MARIEPLKREEMNEAQGRVYDEVAARGGRLGGPNGIYVRVPELFMLNQGLGDYLRACGLTDRLRLIATLVAVRRWNGTYAWGAQSRNALPAGISQEIVDAINRRETPVLDDPDDRAVYEAAVELADTGGLADASFDKAVAALGFNRLLDVVATVGFYTAVALAVSAFEVDPRPDYPAMMPAP